MLDCSQPKQEAVTIDVTVVENDGRYKGNSAVWKFNFRVTSQALEQ